MSPAALALVVIDRDHEGAASEGRWEQTWLPDSWLGDRPAARRYRRRVGARAVHLALVDASGLIRRVVAKPVPGICPCGQPREVCRRNLRFRWPRKCSSLPRAKSITSKNLTRQERRDAEILAFLEPRWDAARPKTRGDCAGQPRPCPWVSCRYNLYLDVADNGSVKINFPGREPDGMPAAGSCVLDIADRVAAGESICLDDIGKLLNLSIERIRQLSSQAQQSARVQIMWQDSLVKIRLPQLPMPRAPWKEMVDPKAARKQLRDGHSCVRVVDGPAELVPPPGRVGR